jgi:hypothetical protein
MRFPASVYKGEKSYLAIYNYFPDISVATPRSIEGRSRRVVHVAYSKQGHERGIDVFEVQGEVFVSDLQIARTMQLTGDIGEQTDRDYNLRMELARGVSSEVISFIRRDVAKFCKFKPAKKSGKSSLDYVEEIIPRTRLRRVVPANLLTPGKTEFNAHCRIGVANLDSGAGCQTGWIPGKNARFDGEFFTDYYLSPDSECDICYAKPKHKAYPKHLYQIDRQRLVDEIRGEARLVSGSKEPYGRQVKIVRLGKRTDFGDAPSRDTLRMVLEVFLEEGVRAVFPNKLLDYDKGIADLLRRTNSVVLFSHGRDDKERGAVALGFPNRVRLENAVKYKEAGVNAIIYHMVYSGEKPSRKDLETIEFAKKHNLGIQLLPVRYSARDTAEACAGCSWDRMKIHRGTSFLGINQELEGTAYVKNGVLIPRRVNLQFMEMVGDNNGSIRMCHHNNTLTWCGDCFLGKGFCAPNKRVEMKDVQRRPRRWKPRNRNQLSLSFAGESNG